MSHFLGPSVMSFNDKKGAIGGEVVRVDVKLWRRGDKKDEHEMGSIEINNVGPTTPEEEKDRGGNRVYHYKLRGGGGVIAGEVTHFRRDGIWVLLGKILGDFASFGSYRVEEPSPEPSTALNQNGLPI